MNQITKAQMDSVSYEDVLKLREIRVLRQTIVDAMSLKQFKPTMFTNHREFALMTFKVSKSKVMRAQAQRIIELWDALKASGENK